MSQSWRNEGPHLVEKLGCGHPLDNVVYACSACIKERRGVGERRARRWKVLARELRKRVQWMREAVATCVACENVARNELEILRAKYADLLGSFEVEAQARTAAAEEIASLRTRAGETEMNDKKTEERLLVSISEAARMLGVSRPTVRKLMGVPGGLPVRPIGRRRLIPVDALRTFAEAGTK